MNGDDNAVMGQVIQVLDDALHLGDRAENFELTTELLGNLPELDSMAVVTVITSLEDYYDFIVDDDEISAETFADVQSLVDFVGSKLAN